METETLLGEFQDSAPVPLSEVKLRRIGAKAIAEGERRLARRSWRQVGAAALLLLGLTGAFWRSAASGFDEALASEVLR